MNSGLFQPVHVGQAHLNHRVVMAPMTRFRCDENHEPLPIVKEYYGQRASTPGTLLIAEAAAVSLKHAGYSCYPGIWSKEQVKKWAEVTKVVHEKHCAIFLQLCGPGRSADSGFPKLAPSAIPLDEDSSAIHIEKDLRFPCPMTKDEIQECIQSFVSAAKNAIAAGFDGVELHGANGYLIDQFLQESANQRTDDWGGSVENRSRFATELTTAVVEEIGCDRVGFRISPWSTYLSIKPQEPMVQFGNLVRTLKSLNLAYLHVVESCVDNWYDIDRCESISFILDIWDNQSPVILTGGYNSVSAANAVDKKYTNYNILVGFGRYFLSTPDLVFRIKHGLEPNPYRAETFYTHKDPRGYIDYASLRG